MNTVLSSGIGNGKGSLACVVRVGAVSGNGEGAVGGGRYRQRDILVAQGRSLAIKCFRLFGYRKKESE